MADTTPQRWEPAAPLGSEAAWSGAHLHPGAAWRARSAPMFSSAPRPVRVMVGQMVASHATRQGRDDMSPPGRPKGEYRSAQHEVARVSAQAAVERLAKRHRQVLVGAWLCSWLAMAGLVGLYGWGSIGNGLAAEMLQMLYGGAALACAMAMVCISVLLADWVTDYALAVEDARNYERDPAMFMQRYSSVLGPAAS